LLQRKGEEERNGEKLARRTERRRKTSIWASGRGCGGAYKVMKETLSKTDHGGKNLWGREGSRDLQMKFA